MNISKSAELAITALLSCVVFVALDAAGVGFLWAVLASVPVGVIVALVCGRLRAVSADAQL